MAGRKEIIRETWKSLGKKYRVMRKNLPLMIGVTEELIRRHPEIELSIMVAVLRVHFGSPYYRRSMSEGGPRYDLDGNPCGEITEVDRADASDRYRKWVSKRKAARAHQALEKERLLVKSQRTSQDCAPQEKLAPNPVYRPLKNSDSSPSGLPAPTKKKARK